ncbi:hypothetical protein K435DRAFT_857267 [Dendrothele bispora CBS 962.96]|uniref:Uncharacterized protein n=1 Tax=Dendrothele bispora (strain CBS 962.96) TaxID=1314807 RepID=A0A4S8M6B7_DENBC|nr:hypothetical protein K435DRAFT_857267 [Dendrothele bispora CBS 962.96]
MPPKTATATKLDFDDAAVIERLEDLRKTLLKVKEHESGGTEVSYVTFRAFEKHMALLPLDSSPKQLSAMCKSRVKAVPHNLRCLLGSAAELASVVGKTRKIDQSWVPEPEEIEELFNADPDFDLEAEITLPNESDGETSARESPAPSTPDSFHFIRRSAAKAMASSKEASPDEKDRPKPKKKPKPTSSTIEEYSPIRQTSKQAPPTFQKPRGVKRQMEVEILTTPESTSGNNKNKKSDTARPAKRAKTSTTATEPKKGILKKTSTVTEPRTRRQHSRARSAAPSNAEHEGEDGDSESRPSARAIKVDKGKKRARAPSAPPSNAGDVEEEEEDDDSSKTRRKSTRKESRRERTPTPDPEDEGPVFGPFVLPTIRETSTEPPVLIDDYKSSRYTVSFRQQKSNKEIHSLSQGGGDLRVIAPLATQHPISLNINSFLKSNVSTAFAFEPCLRCMERNLRCNPIAPKKGAKGRWFTHKCGHCTTAGQVCSLTLDLDSLAEVKNLMSIFSRDSDIALKGELETLGSLYSMRDTTRQQINLAMTTLRTLNDDIEFRKTRIKEAVQNPTTLVHLLEKSTIDGEPMSEDQVKLLLAATGWQTDPAQHIGTELKYDSDDHEWKIVHVKRETSTSRDPSPMNVDDSFTLRGDLLSPPPPSTSKASTSRASSNRASTSFTQTQEDESLTDSGDENGAGPSTRRKSRSTGTTPKHVEFRGSASSSVPVTSRETRAKNRPRSPVASPSVSKNSKKQGSKPKNKKFASGVSGIALTVVFLVACIAEYHLICGYHSAHKISQVFFDFLTSQCLATHLTILMNATIVASALGWYFAAQPTFLHSVVSTQTDSLASIATPNVSLTIAMLNFVFGRGLLDPWNNSRRSQQTSPLRLAPSNYTILILLLSNTNDM